MSTPIMTQAFVDWVTKMDETVDWDGLNPTEHMAMAWNAAIAYANTPRSTKTDPPRIGQEVLVWLGGADLWTGGKWDHALSSDRYPYWLPMPPKPEGEK